MDINYLSTLDYIDMRNLCISSKQLSYICNDNTSLRSIIYNKNNNVEISPNFNISGALKDIYSSIQKVMDDNYPEETLPRWVNKKLFNDDMLRNFMVLFLEVFVAKIVTIYYESENEPFLEINKVELYQSSVIAVLYSNNVDFADLECTVSDIPNTIMIPKSFYKYISPTVKKLVKYVKHNNREYYDVDYHILFKALTDMLFVQL